MQYKLYRDAETGKFDTIGIGELYAIVTLDGHIYQFCESNYSGKIKIKNFADAQIVFYNKIASAKYVSQTSIIIPLTGYPVNQYLLNLFAGGFNV